jgi:osmoprotectant transport system ATP-binding protein
LITFANVSKRYPNAAAAAVDDVSFEVPSGTFVVLLGPSGCGKTTLLKMTNRLYEPTAGTILLDERDIRAIKLTDLRRQMGYVIQQVGLFPHMTVAENISVVPNLLKWDTKRTAERIDELLELVHLPLDFRSRYPAQLSGGQQQRVGLARALAADPDVLLMDEPFGAIDAITRASLQDEMRQLQDQLKKTVLFVTHDVDEALRLADRIVVLQAGKLVQYDEPCVIMNNPANEFVRALLDTDDRIRQISLLRLEAVMSPLQGSEDPAAPRLADDSDVRQALSRLLQPGVNQVIVTRGGQAVGRVTLRDVRQAGCPPEEP